MFERAISTNSIIEIAKDKKSPTWIVTKTDAEGFHHQLSLTIDELFELGKLCFKIFFREFG